MSQPKFSSRILRRFVEAAAAELGTDQLNAMLVLSEQLTEWTHLAALQKLNEVEAARMYASLQSAMRTYYGRGARGVLLRVGQRLWPLLLEDAALTSKAQAAVIRRLPQNSRRKPALELLSRFLGAHPGDLTVHSQDLDLLLADHASPTTQGVQHSSPICFVTQGLISESLLWATGQRHDVEETACRARGDHDCEFKITMEK